MDTLQLEVTMMPVTRYKDGGVGIKFVTLREVGHDSFATIDGYRQQNGWMLFRPNKFSESEIPSDDVKVEDGFTPSQQLRKYLYKLFMTRGGKPEDFQPWYRQQMQIFLDMVGEKIEAAESKGDGTQKQYPVVGK